MTKKKNEKARIRVKIRLFSEKTKNNQKIC